MREYPAETRKRISSGQLGRLAQYASRERLTVIRSVSEIVVDQTEMKDDLVQDMVEVLTEFCARLYGRRAAKNRAAKALAAAEP